MRHHLQGEAIEQGQDPPGHRIDVVTCHRSVGDTLADDARQEGLPFFIESARDALQRGTPRSLRPRIQPDLHALVVVPGIDVEEGPKPADRIVDGIHGATHPFEVLAGDLLECLGEQLIHRGVVVMDEPT